MKENSRIRFNPVTKEIEVEGSEKFVKTYFGKLQAMISEAPAKMPKRKGSRAVKAAPTKKSKKAAKKEPGKKKETHIDKVVGLIQGSVEGISTAELIQKTGLSERQIWGIATRAAKMGKIRKVKRGVYIGA